VYRIHYFMLNTKLRK